MGPGDDGRSGGGATGGGVRRMVAPRPRDRALGLPVPTPREPLARLGQVAPLVPRRTGLTAVAVGTSAPGPRPGPLPVWVDRSRPRRPLMGDSTTDSRNIGGETLAFAPPYERDGTTVITAAAARAHTATRGNGTRADQRPFDAQMSGARPLGAFVVRDGRVRWHPVVDVTRVITTAELVVGGVLVAR